MGDNSDEIEVRALDAADAAALRALRLRTLLEDPIPFLASHEEEASRPVEDLARRLQSSDASSQVLGAFRGGTLVGTLGFYRHAQIKARHRAFLWGMFVAPEARRRGAGKALLLAAIERLRAVGDVEQVELTVVTSEEPARRLYLGAGFVVQGLLRNAMKAGDVYFDEEELVLWLRGAPMLPQTGG